MEDANLRTPPGLDAEPKERQHSSYVEQLRNELLRLSEMSGLEEKTAGKKSLCTTVQCNKGEDFLRFVRLISQVCSIFLLCALVTSELVKV